MRFKFPINPALREFTYNLLYHLQGDKEFVLKSSYRELGKTSAKAKKFCNKASLEMIMHMLSLMGYRWTLILFDDSRQPETIRQLFEDYKSNTIDLNKIIKSQLFVTTNKEFVEYLGLAAEQVANGEYKRNVELLRAGYHVRNFDRKLRSQNANEAIEDLESLDYLSKLCIGSFFTGQYTELLNEEFCVLFYLFPFRKQYVKKDAIINRFRGLHPPARISRALFRLIRFEYIQKPIDPKEKSYKITGLGESEVIKLLNGVLKHITFL